MRAARSGEDLRGKVCSNSIGRPGIVVGRGDLGWGEVWVGISVAEDGHRCWSSSEPFVICDTLEEFYVRSKKAYGDPVARVNGVLRNNKGMAHRERELSERLAEVRAEQRAHAQRQRDQQQSIEHRFKENWNGLSKAQRKSIEADIAMREQRFESTDVFLVIPYQ